ncbi:MAG: hypothetical protein OEY24_03155 [Candidatus Bathyarchaeota archaeon]|nr:hypothetical protein [Candidatus Bathyarchaeota archaeon]MDH5494684.1 hypothetical protein [Candidatus Bathyarchaeota archaeon]
MKNKLKIIAGITLVLGIVSIALLATPIQAYVNGTSNGDLLRTQDQRRLGAKDCECDGDVLQERDRDRLRIQDCDCNCTCNGTQQQSRVRQRINECSMNRICNYTKSMEQYRCQHTERTKSLAR